MKLIVTEKNIAAKKIAAILGGSSAHAGKVYQTPVYYFDHEGDECVTIGLRGHILEVIFPEAVEYRKKKWEAIWDTGEMTPAELPDTLATPPWKKASKVFPKTGVRLASWNIKALPYLTWAPVGKQVAEKEIVRALKTLAKKSDHIVIATDFDREGELIGSDARDMVREVNKDALIDRARYSAITKDEITRAFSDLAPVDDNLAQAGEARQDIDLIWGAVLTRYLTKVRFSGIGNPRSAGRVQTPTLKLIVDKEAEREAFVPEDYWVVSGEFATEEGARFKARHEADHFKDESRAINAFKTLEAALKSAAADGARVDAIVSKKRSQRPPVPFNTTSLQVTAAAEGLSPSRTMRLAESLYMNGLISYPRVDNTVYPASLDLKGIVKALGTVDYYAPTCRELLKKPLHATRGDKETTDHPPIHPTGAADPHKLRADEWKLYNLIARRFLATLSDKAVVEETAVTVAVEDEKFIARGNVVISAGFRAIYPYGRKKEVQLPALKEGQPLSVVDADFEAKQTKPPARYNEGSIITKMEKEGLGTKATRHDAIAKLITRSYIAIEDKQLRPTMLGTSVIEALSSFAERITLPVMTSDLETEMDNIALGKTTRPAVVNHSRMMLAQSMEGLIEKSTEVGEMLAKAAEFDARVGTCPKCGNEMMVKTSQKNRSQFVGCKGYPDCDNTYPLPDGKIDPLPEQCPECGAPRVRIIRFRQKPLERCLNPECPTNYEAPITLGECPVCKAAGREGKLIGQRSQRTLKRFARCENYDICETSFPLPANGQIKPTGEICDACGFPEIEVETRRGPWKLCPNLDCPKRAEEEKKKAAKGSTRTRAAGAKKKAPAKKKATAKKATSKKAPAKKKSAAKSAQ